MDVMDKANVTQEENEGPNPSTLSPAQQAHDALIKEVANIKDVEFVVVQARKQWQLVIKAGW